MNDNPLDNDAAWALMEAGKRTGKRLAIVSGLLNPWRERNDRADADDTVDFISFSPEPLDLGEIYPESPRAKMKSAQ